MYRTKTRKSKYIGSLYAVPAYGKVSKISILSSTNDYTEFEPLKLRLLFFELYLVYATAHIF